MISRFQPSAVTCAVQRLGLATALGFALCMSAHAGQSAEAGAAPWSAFGAASLQAASAATDQVIVKYKSASRRLQASALSGTQSAAAVARLGVAVTAQRQLTAQTDVLRLSRRVSLDDARDLANRIAADNPDVEYAEPDRLLQIQATPTDTRYGEQWHYFESTGGLNLPTAWDSATGAGVVVAVIDTGYRPHADLRANLLPGYDFISDVETANDGDGRDSDASDPGDAFSAGECGSSRGSSSSWHGTHVAGTIAAAANGTGVVGVAYNAKVVPVRVLGKCGGYTSDIAQGIIWASGGSVSGVPANANPARVINLSLGGGGSCDRTTQDAINSARSRKTVVVVAAGNSSSDAGSFTPANCSGVITVAATNRSGSRSYYSNYGSTVEVAAPGGETSTGSANGILSTLNSGQTSPGADSYGFYQGTSMAAPHVAGAAALVIQANNALTSDEVSKVLVDTARPFPGSCSGCGRGIVDAAAAVAAAGGDPGGGDDVVETEPNDSRSQAQVIAESGSTVKGSMGSSGDRDYFKVSVGAGRTLSVALAPNSSSDYDLYVYNASGTRVGRSELPTGERDSVSVRAPSAGGTYYIEVRYYSGSTGAQGVYTLDASF